MIANDIRFAVGYARRSTDLQERSLPDQKAAVERWARDHGFRILRWFVDDAISGTSARGRDQFTRLIHEAENGRDFDAVLCYDMSRFSRGGTNETLLDPSPPSGGRRGTSPPRASRRRRR